MVHHLTTTDNAHRLLRVGVISTSSKENERRVPLHPDHLGQIPGDIRACLCFEQDYGRPFGVTDEDIARFGCATLSRSEILAGCDLVTITKPVAEDLAAMRRGAVLWGWAHCVQNADITQIAIDRRLTIISWEGMNQWGPEGKWQSHVFQKNNEIAGYAAVLHALGIMGIGGPYGPPLRAIVIGFGSVGRGAVRSLKSQGVGDITVFTENTLGEPANPIPGVTYRHFCVDDSGLAIAVGTADPFITMLGAADIIINAILQDTDRPVMFLRDEETTQLKPQSLVIDVSCDAGMGFPFARPTTFSSPAFEAGQVTYYAVDHTPSYLWRSASWEISEALLPFLPVVAAGPTQWAENETIRRAVEIREGLIENPKILSFQKRSPQYPHGELG